MQNYSNFVLNIGNFYTQLGVKITKHVFYTSPRTASNHTTSSARRTDGCNSDNTWSKAESLELLGLQVTESLLATSMWVTVENFPHSGRYSYITKLFTTLPTMELHQYVTFLPLPLQWITICNFIIKYAAMKAKYSAPSELPLLDHPTLPHRALHSYFRITLFSLFEFSILPFSAFYTPARKFLFTIAWHSNCEREWQLYWCFQHRLVLVMAFTVNTSVT